MLNGLCSLEESLDHRHARCRFRDRHAAPVHRLESSAIDLRRVSGAVFCSRGISPLEDAVTFALQARLQLLLIRPRLFTPSFDLNAHKTILPQRTERTKAAKWNR